MAYDIRKLMTQDRASALHRLMWLALDDLPKKGDDVYLLDIAIAATGVAANAMERMENVAARDSLMNHIISKLPGCLRNA